jgi:hypothetical protein
MTTRDLANTRPLPRCFTVGLFTFTLILLLFNASRWLTRAPGTSVYENILPLTLQSIGFLFLSYGMAWQSKRMRALSVLSIAFTLSALLLFIADKIPALRARV